jgi:DNA polymerase elongation subunit (family B)
MNEPTRVAYGRTSLKISSMDQNELLFGADPAEGLVAVEPVGEQTMRLFFREGRALRTAEEPFTPFILLEDQDLMNGFDFPFRIEPLSGSGAFGFLALFSSWGDCQKAKTLLQQTSGESSSSHAAPYLFLSDPVHQYLLLTGKTLFKGLHFGDLHRLAMDIETACTPGYEFSNPQRKEDRILSIALMDNRGYAEVLFGKEMTEKEMISTLGERIAELDPDVLEGHNFFNFDLEYILARARMHRVRLKWGRDGSPPKVRRSRFTVAERIIDYTRMEVFGRHLVDTLFLLQYYDVAARELESYSLKAAAKHFGLAEADRTYIDGDKIQWTYDNDPEALKRYNLGDVRETLAISELLGYPFFLQARIFPYSYQNIFVRGNATKINGLLMREYLRKRASIPKPKGKSSFEGGYTDIFKEGVVRNVLHCDVASLYPSILLAFDLAPTGDTLQVFPKLLKDLRAFRLEAKKRAKEAPSPRVHDYYEGLQQTFKVLINSFYGYLGTEIHPFSDPEIASEVTRKGRELIRQMLGWLEKEGAEPVEIDTDGIYFTPPEDVGSHEAAQRLVERLSESLPAGIEVELDGFYPAMFSYKKKNYALLDEGGNVVIKGSALRSRGMERYLRDFLSDMLKRLLEGRGEEVRSGLETTIQRLHAHDVPIQRLAKKETLTDPLDVYRQKVKTGKRNPSAPYELALASGRDFRPGDQISYYVTGQKKKVKVYENCKMASSYDPERPDENVAYYQDKLVALVDKFNPYLP